MKRIKKMQKFEEGLGKRGEELESAGNKEYGEKREKKGAKREGKGMI